MVRWYKYYVSGHYPSSCLYLKTRYCLFFKTQRFGDRILSPSSGLVLWIGTSWGFTWRRRQNPVSETLCFEKIKRAVFLDKDRTMDNVQKHNILQIFIWVSCLMTAILNWHEPTLHSPNNSVCETRLYLILSKFVCFENETYKRKARPTLFSSMGYSKCVKLKL
jgi:hypothetical protein